MDQPTIVGIVHGVSPEGTAVLRRQLRRGQVLAFFSRLESCLIGMETCSGARHWARELTALGHEVRLMPASYVKPYVKRGKTEGGCGGDLRSGDAADNAGHARGVPSARRR